MFLCLYSVSIQTIKTLMLDNFVSSVAVEKFCVLRFFKFLLYVSTWKISNTKSISVVLGYVFS